MDAPPDILLSPASDTLENSNTLQCCHTPAQPISDLPRTPFVDPLRPVQRPASGHSKPTTARNNRFAEYSSVTLSLIRSEPTPLRITHPQVPFYTPENGMHIDCVHDVLVVADHFLAPLNRTAILMLTKLSFFATNRSTQREFRPWGLIYRRRSPAGDSEAGDT